MRFLILLFAVFLVSCATPKTAPQSFYGGVYAPGAVSIEGSEYVSRSGVLDDADSGIARKAAFARLMLQAKEAGYESFSIANEGYSRILGVSFIVRGKLFKGAPVGKGVYRLDAIKRLLRDLPLEAPKPKPKPRVKPRKKETVQANRNNRVQREVAPAPKAEPVSDDPLVIMAPEDITGSIRRSTSANGVSAPMRQAPGDLTPLSGDNDFVRPGAVSNLPTGVILRRK